MRLLAPAAGANRLGPLMRLVRVPYPPHWRVIGNGLLAGACRFRRPALSRVREQLAQLTRTCTNGFYWEGCRRSSGRAALGRVWRAMCDESACAIRRWLSGAKRSVCCPGTMTTEISPET